MLNCITNYSLNQLFSKFNKKTSIKISDISIVKSLAMLSIGLASVAVNATTDNSSTVTTSEVPSYKNSILSFFNAHNLTHGHETIQLGAHCTTMGQRQHVNINGLIGDEFTVTSKSGGNGLFGVGYYVDGQDKNLYSMNYGLNWFYLPKTRVSGYVVQENLFTNLAYAYNATNYPLYAIAKSTFKTKYPNYGITLDLGIGPNFMTTGQFTESSLNDNTIPDHIFSGKTTTTFSATFGAGVKVNQFLGNVPLECGYRFFYLGQGNFNALSNQVLNTLNTGNAYANALMCAITV